MHYNTYTGGAWQGYCGAVTEDAVDDASLAWLDDELWAVYGRRDTDLQWDLWVCTPDPVEIAEPSTSTVEQLSVSVTGRNPFRGSVVLSIFSPSAGNLRIYDLSGRTILDRQVESGLFTWTGTSDTGVPVPSGVYFAVVTDGSSMKSCRLVKI